MANKYAEDARQARRERRRAHRARQADKCSQKRAYDSQDEARQEGQDHYLCKTCGKWHRSGALARRAARMRQRRRDG